MKKLLIIPAILATAFSTSVAMDQKQANLVSASQEKTESKDKPEVKTDEVFFVGQKELKISDSVSFEFSNIIGYKSILDAKQEKNGQPIGIKCILVDKSSDERLEEMWMYGKDVIDDYWLVVSKVQGKTDFTLLKPEECYNNIEFVASGSNGFDRNWIKCAMLNFKSQVNFIETFVPGTYHVHRLFFLSFDENNASWVKATKEWAKSLSAKDDYSNAEKVAIFYAVQILVGLCK